MPLIPVTKEQWQDAVDAAHALMNIEAARLYGLVTGGPEVNVERCVEILEDGRKQGVLPRPDAIKRFIEEHNTMRAAEVERECLSQHGINYS